MGMNKCSRGSMNYGTYSYGYDLEFFTLSGGYGMWGYYSSIDFMGYSVMKYLSLSLSLSLLGLSLNYVPNPPLVFLPIIPTLGDNGKKNQESNKLAQDSAV
ncbi:hypothetical protein AYI68_g7099 [Smittium mucronatum]|uniref:Uncharacterized protein n=1 Tax=Smittium mucronatum TaxID=133383 RepID=A0A1R0GPL7_9FUNG|nr:hypothetical protein AYI68_g7099 [Smittium mucronatum]